MGSSPKKIASNVRIGVNIRIYEEKPSGIQNFIRGLFTQLIQHYPSYHFIFFSTGNKTIEKNAEYISSSYQSSLIYKINPRLVNILFDNLFILKRIYQNKIRIFIGASYILPLIKLRNTRYVTIIYDLSYLTYIHSKINPYMNLVLYMKFVVPLALKKADRIIVPSHFVKSQIIQKYHTDEKKITVIYGGHDTYFIKVRNKKLFEALQKKYTISPHFCFTNATNHERKNIFGLVDAFARSTASKSMDLVFSGLLPEETIVQLRTYIKKKKLEKRIKFLGFVTKEELRLLYSYAKFFVFPSFEEGFGFPILEAAACGCLPICSNTGALPELIGNSKLVFNPKDVNSITKKINEVVVFSRLQYAKELSQVVKHMKKFSWENSAKEYDKVFQRLITPTI